MKLQFVTISADTSQQSVLESLVIDAALSELHTSDAEVTEFPVEEGSDITDNIRLKPKGLKVEALICDFHLRSRDGLPTPGWFSTGKLKDVDAKTSLAKLENYQANGTLINVETGLKAYQDMVIESMSTPRDVKISIGNGSTAGALKTTIVLKSIIIAQSQTVVVKQADPKAQPSQPKGAKTATAADSGQQENKSDAASAVDKATDGRLGKALSDTLKKAAGLFGG